MTTTNVSKRLQLRVLDTLRTAGQPLTTSEVAMMVNRSFEATRKALNSVGAVRVEDAFPTEWTIATADTPSSMRKAPSKFSDIEYTVGTKEVPQLVDAWNKQRGKLGEVLALTEINSKADPKHLALQLGTVAGTLAALSYSLSEVANLPDWYDSLTKDK